MRPQPSLVVTNSVEDLTMKHLDRFRLLGYHNTRIFQLLSTAGSVASLVAVAVPSALNSGQIAWWAIALFILAGLLAVPAVWFIFRTEHSTKVFRNDDQSAIGKYLSHWIGTGRQVVVSTSTTVALELGSIGP